MAEDLNKKMEPEISDAASDVAKEEASVVEAAEKKAAKAAKEEVKAAKEEAKAAKVEAKAAEAATVAAAAAATAEANKEAAKAAEEAAKAAKKAEEQAAKEAAKQKAAAEKEAEKARIAKEKADAKIEKKRQKKAAQQALIDACPPQYRPVATSTYFWLAFLSAIPVIGVIATLILSFAGRNKNRKNFERAILAYYIIGLILCLVAVLIVGLLLPDSVRESVLLALEQIVKSFKFS